ncbi:MAG: hypothetical protein AAF845_12410 [Bacteroidota bacterium]
MRASALALLLLAVPAFAQEANPADVASPEAIVAAVYASLDRAPGEDHDWDRFLTLYHPDARLLPNPEQMNGAERVFTPREYADYYINLYASVDFLGSPNDQGFSEAQVHHVTHRFGDVATVFSTYEKSIYQGEEMLGRGINSFQLVFREGRWWVVSVAWDEEDGAGPVPDEFRASE